MNLKTKVFGLLATGLLALGVSAPALADSEDITFEITSTDEFSVVIDDSTDFSAQPFTINTPAYNWTIQGFYDYTVTDLRGTETQGWSVNSSATTFINTVTNATVASATLHTSNNTQWYVASPSGFVPGPNSNADGVTIATDSANIIPTGHVILQAAIGATPPDNKDKGAGSFSAEEALYLTFPGGVAAGTYSSTVTLTLSSVDI